MCSILYECNVYKVLGADIKNWIIEKLVSVKTLYTPITVNQVNKILEDTSPRQQLLSIEDN